MKLLHSYINGCFARGERTFAKINPVDGSLVAQVAEADRAMVDEAVVAARQALAGPWGAFTTRERAAMLHKVAEGIEARFGDFLTAEIADTGRPISLASKIDIPRGAANFRIFADLIKNAGLESFQTETADGASAINYAIRKPVGVVGVITPWNLPLLLLTWKVAPALACGNCVVVKPSEETPSTATLLAEVTSDAGLPPGVFNVVHGFGPDSVGEFLTTHEEVEPTIITGLPESARCVKEEIFGPVCHIAPFDTEEEAIAKANDTRYGLAASVWTTNLKRGHRVAQRMKAGITWVNCWFLRDLRTPFGGVGLSGIGREGGLHSLNFYSELNNICIRL